MKLVFEIERGEKRFNLGFELDDNAPEALIETTFDMAKDAAIEHLRDRANRIDREGAPKPLGEMPSLKGEKE